MRDPIRAARYILPQWPAPANVGSCMTTRIGGHSAAPFDSFNHGNHVGDDSSLVADNRALLQADWQLADLQFLQQTHSTRIVEAAFDDIEVDADGSWTERQNSACVVMTADCLPVLLCNRAGTRVMAVHAGWRGLHAGILQRAVEHMACEPEDLLLWLGPAISSSAFEVGSDVQEAFLSGSAGFEAETAACFVPTPRVGHYLADLYALARLSLRAVGVDESAIFGGEFCTFTDVERFYSYRRDGQCGRMAAAIWLRAGSVYLTVC